MINILPEEKKKLIKEERTRRFILVLGFCLFFFLILLATLSLPSLFHLKTQKKEIKRLIGVLEAGPIFKEIQEIERSIQSLNRKLTLFQNNQARILNPSLFIFTILENKPEVVKIEIISFDKLAKIPKVSLQGKSPKREELLTFIENLEHEKLIKKVHSPITNILRDKDIEFSLIAEF